MLQLCSAVIPSSSNIAHWLFHYSGPWGEWMFWLLWLDITRYSTRQASATKHYVTTLLALRWWMPSFCTKICAKQQDRTSTDDAGGVQGDTCRAADAYWLTEKHPCSTIGAIWAEQGTTPSTSASIKEQTEMLDKTEVKCSMCNKTLRFVPTKHSYNKWHTENMWMWTVAQPDSEVEM